jgi:large subunit ribosomal protein L5
MPLGATVSLGGQEMYNFLDKMIQCVLPRIREWPGVNPIGDDKGSISFMLPASAVGTFPDIEPHFDSFPRLFDIEVLLFD